MIRLVGVNGGGGGRLPWHFVFGGQVVIVVTVVTVIVSVAEVGFGSTAVPLSPLG
jgi:hypothetical protein